MGDVGDGMEGRAGRSLSILERPPEVRLRGGGGGGGMLTEFELSFETVRWVLRVEFIDEVRARAAGDGGSEDKVVRRAGGGVGDDRVGLRAVADVESSVVEEFALDVLIVARVAPRCRVGGGGGGTFCEDGDIAGSRAIAGLGIPNSVEC
jgi:hypothetical protein